MPSKGWWDGSADKAPSLRIQVQSIPGTYKVEGENRLLKIVLWPPKYAHAHTNSTNDGRKERWAGQPPTLTTHIFIPISPERWLKWITVLAKQHELHPRIHIVETTNQVPEVVLWTLYIHHHEYAPLYTYSIKQKESMVLVWTFSSPPILLIRILPHIFTCPSTEMLSLTNKW